MIPRQRRSTAVAAVAAVDAAGGSPDRRTGANLAMIGCRLAMAALGVSLLLLAPAGAGPSSGSVWWLLLPMIGCGAMHFVMYRSTGQSCHSRSKSRGGGQE